MIKPCPVLVKNEMLGITDLNANLWDIAKDIKKAKFKIRDEKNIMTWVYDRLLGFTPDNCVDNYVQIESETNAPNYKYE
jgi:hypothetical protein